MQQAAAPLDEGLFTQPAEATSPPQDVDAASSAAPGAAGAAERQHSAQAAPSPAGVSGLAGRRKKTSRVRVGYARGEGGAAASPAAPQRVAAPAASLGAAALLGASPLTAGPADVQQPDLAAAPSAGLPLADALWAEADGDGDGVASGGDVVPLFQRSKLSNDALGDVWEVASMSSSARGLDRTAFDLALKLIACVQRGGQCTLDDVVERAAAGEDLEPDMSGAWMEKKADEVPTAPALAPVPVMSAPVDSTKEQKTRSVRKSPHWWAGT